MKYEIEIKGLPEGWEPERFGIPKEKDTIITRDGTIIAVKDMIDPPCGPRLIVRRKVSKYDWSKTLDDVLVSDSSTLYGAPIAVKKGELMPGVDWKIRIASVWQPNIHGCCPVDPDASIVRVRFMDGDERESLARNFIWKFSFHPGVIISYQFIRLSDNVEW